NRLALPGAHLHAAELGHPLGPQLDLTPPLRLRTGDHRLARLAAAQLEDHAGRGFHRRDNRRRVDAALEAVTSVAHNAALAPGRRGPQRVEQRAFQVDVRGLLGATRRLATDHATQPLRPTTVGDDRDLIVELVL